jgi:hypothetical protein
MMSRVEFYIYLLAYRFPKIIPSGVSNMGDSARNFCEQLFSQREREREGGGEDMAQHFD